MPRDEELRIGPLLSSFVNRLADAGVPNARQEAEWLACHALRLSTVALLAHPERVVTAEDAAKLDILFQCREAGEPLQYLLGKAPFWGRDFHVGPGVLIPRRDTETLIEAALSLFPHDAPFTFLDWGTGSGCIAATLLLEFPNASAILVDRSPTALDYAGMNLARYHLEGRALLLRSSVPDDLTIRGRCDLVVSNPPYIPTDTIPTLMREVRDYEPHEALDGGADGMDCYKALFKSAPRWLKPGGLLILESGDAGQAEALRSPAFERFQRFNKRKLRFVLELKDDAEIPRCTVWQCQG